MYVTICCKLPIVTTATPILQEDGPSDSTLVNSPTTGAIDASLLSSPSVGLMQRARQEWYRGRRATKEKFVPPNFHPQQARQAEIGAP
eukprot:4558270-Amphidinium_carterae.2